MGDSGRWIVRMECPEAGRKVVLRCACGFVIGACRGSWKSRRRIGGVGSGRWW